MRFRGGGIGHKATQRRMETFSSEWHHLPSMEDDIDEIPFLTDDEQDSQEGEGDTDGEDDLMSDEEDSDDAGDMDSEANLGPEDGEEGWEDEYDIMGFAEP